MGERWQNFFCIKIGAVGNTVKNRWGSTQCGEFFINRRAAAVKCLYYKKLDEGLVGWQHSHSSDVIGRVTIP
jgi:hypothetical protein